MEPTDDELVVVVGGSPRPPGSSRSAKRPPTVWPASKPLDEADAYAETILQRLDEGLQVDV